MDICMIHSLPIPPEDGLGNYVYNLSRQFIGKGHNVTIITRGNSGSARESVLDGIKLYRAPFVPLYPFHVHIHGIFVNRLLSSLEKDIDIIHVHTPLPPVIKANRPTLLTIHTLSQTENRHMESVDPYYVASRLQGRISYGIEKKLIASSDKITSVSSSINEELTWYGINNVNVEVIGNGVDEKRFFPMGEGRRGKYVLCVSRLSYRKGLFDLIRCAAIVCGQDPEVTFKIAGKGPLLSMLSQEIDRAGLTGRVQIIGFVDCKALVELYQKASLFVLPSHYEGLPTTLLEAMACGLPVVATSINGNLDVIEPGKNGVLVPPGAPEAMASAIMGLLRDDGLRARLGRSARDTIEKGYTWDIISDKVLLNYRSLML